MKKLISLLFGLITLALSAQSTFDPDALQSIASGEARARALTFGKGAPTTGDDYDVKWYGCHWTIDPAVRAISGIVVMRFQPLVNGFTMLKMDLSDSLQVDLVTFRNLAPSWTHAGNVLSITLPVPMQAGETDSVTVIYHGIPPDNGFGAFVKAEHAGVPIIWTLSEPYGSSDWWPCKNGLTDKADSVDLFIRSPKAYKAASNGLMVEQNPDGNDIVWHWKHRYPVAAYLVCMAVTNFARYDHKVPFGGDTLTVANYVYPEDSASAASQTGMIVPMIQVYDSLFGIYPFQQEKYGHVEFGWGGGMEHQTMTFVTGWGFELLAHELAHQWFGDKVTCGTWSDIWLNEGFATYLSGLCYEHLIPDLFKRFREVRVQGITAYPGGSVYCPDTTDVWRIFDGRLSYAKGALVLHQLRWIMGDQAFFAGLNNYLADPALAYGFARTSQLKAHLESAGGQDLTWYFDDWYTGEGFPSYQANWMQEGDTVYLTLRQTQSHPSVSFFEMKVPVKLKNAQRDTIINVMNTYSGESFRIFLPFSADSLIIDPEYQLITANNTVSAVPQIEAANLRVFPNPAVNSIRIECPGLKRGKGGVLSLFAPDGRLLENFTVPNGESGVTLPLGHYPSGLYLFNLQTTEQSLRGKFVITR